MRFTAHLPPLLAIALASCTDSEADARGQYPINGVAPDARLFDGAELRLIVDPDNPNLMMADHTSSLPASGTAWTRNGGDTALTNNLIYLPDTAYWSVRSDGEFQVGDFRPAIGGGSPYVTQHRVWAR